MLLSIYVKTNCKLAIFSFKFYNCDHIRRIHQKQIQTYQKLIKHSFFLFIIPFFPVHSGCCAFFSKVEILPKNILQNPYFNIRITSKG